MSGVKHTPGRWSARLQNSRARRYDCRLQPFWETPVHVGEGSTAGNVICTVLMGGRGATESTKEAVEANARLIAAAPDLLEALEAVELARLSDASSDWLRATRLSDAAIARARGEQDGGGE